ncbi:MAG: glycerol-3-phosphate 1-O-acyltransferase PlsY [Candidatus Zixiibacteriota bacterium]|nr:MAG: glycerol-3-phosphate 1-O-acyltransferase PlsY [candidate division Zixibacteria bacterium]
MVTIIVAAAIGYILGSIPTGVWLGKAIKGIDLREHGSKSMGATNVFRVLGWKLAIVALIIDVAKGFFAAFIASGVNLGDSMLTSYQLALIAGLAAIIGHLYPLFAYFKGGKGIATGAGMLLYLAPLELGFAVLVFVLTVLISRYVSLGSLMGATFFAVSIILERYYLHYPHGDEMVVFAILIFILVLITHRSNIKRLLEGNENRLGARK